MFGLDPVHSKARKWVFFGRKEWNIMHLAGSDPAAGWKILNRPIENSGNTANQLLRLSSSVPTRTDAPGRSRMR